VNDFSNSSVESLNALINGWQAFYTWLFWHAPFLIPLITRAHFPSKQLGHPQIKLVLIPVNPTEPDSYSLGTPIPFLTYRRPVMETGNRRVSSHGRGLPGGRRRVDNYFPDTEGMDEKEVAQINLGQLRDLAHKLGYDSLFDVAIAEARHSPLERDRFVEEGRLEELYRYVRPNRRNDIQNQQFDEEICQLSRSIYVKEWKRLTGDSKLKNTVIKGDSPDDFSQPYFSELYFQMQAHAPQLFALIDSFIPDVNKQKRHDQNDDNEQDKENNGPEIVDLTLDEDTSHAFKSRVRQRKENAVVVAICVLQYQANQKTVNCNVGLPGYCTCTNFQRRC
jgi:hypothetical protein